MSIAIQSAGLAHAAVLAELHGRSFPPSEQWQTPAMQDLLALPGVQTGLILHEQQPAGFIMLRTVADEAEILTVCVVPPCRRAGLGQALLAWAIQYAKDHAATKLFLEVSSANVAAQTLYKQAGFAQVGHRKRYYPDGSDALVLSRSC